MFHGAVIALDQRSENVRDGRTDNAWAGIDVGKTHHWVCAVDADGKTLLSVKVANDEADIVSLIAAVTALTSSWSGRSTSSARRRR